MIFVYSLSVKEIKKFMGVIKVKKYLILYNKNMKYYYNVDVRVSF